MEKSKDRTQEDPPITEKFDQIPLPKGGSGTSKPSPKEVLPELIPTPVTPISFLSRERSAVSQIDPRKPRLSVVVNVYHQRPDREATSVVGRFSRELTVDEQVYVREKDGTNKYEDLDTGWVKNPSCIVIENKGKHPIGVGISGCLSSPFCVVNPNECVVFTPSPHVQYAVCIGDEKCPYTITAIPG